MSFLTSLDEWRELSLHSKHIKRMRIDELFKQDPQREQRHTYSIGGLTVDFSKNLFNETTLHLLQRLAEKLEINQFIKQLFTCEKVNVTENRAALHAALRSPSLFSGQYYTQTMARKITPPQVLINTYQYLCCQKGQ